LYNIRRSKTKRTGIVDQNVQLPKDLLDSEKRVLHALVVRDIELDRVDVGWSAHARCCDLAGMSITTSEKYLVIRQGSDRFDYFEANALVATAGHVVSLGVGRVGEGLEIRNKMRRCVAYVTRTMVLVCVVILEGRERSEGRDMVEQIHVAVKLQMFSDGGLGQFEVERYRFFVDFGFY
jgi:hypothetical protein